VKEKNQLEVKRISGSRNCGYSWCGYHLLSEPIVSNGGVLSIPTLTSFEIRGLKERNGKIEKELSAKLMSQRQRKAQECSNFKRAVS